MFGLAWQFERPFKRKPTASLQGQAISYLVLRHHWVVGHQLFIFVWLLQVALCRVLGRFRWRIESPIRPVFAK
jgi:hypothetical protein